MSVDVWAVDLRVTRRRLTELWQLLAHDERLRAARFKLGRDRRRFVAARAFRRLVLAGYTATPPERIRYRCEPSGRPALWESAGQSSAREALHFSASRSVDVAVCAVSRGRRLGVDVEDARVDLPAAELAARFFHPSEWLAISGLAGEGLRAAFFKAWTRKEAYSKALGTGLALPFESLAASSRSGWSLHDLTLGRSHVGALVVEGSSVDRSAGVRVAQL